MLKTRLEAFRELLRDMLEWPDGGELAKIVANSQNQGPATCWDYLAAAIWCAPALVRS
jgi:hypothetical protein